jgi:hypothetical protein
METVLVGCIEGEEEEFERTGEAGSRGKVHF